MATRPSASATATRAAVAAWLDPRHAPAGRTEEHLRALRAEAARLAAAEAAAAAAADAARTEAAAAVQSARGELTARVEELDQAIMDCRAGASGEATLRAELEEVVRSHNARLQPNARRRNELVDEGLAHD